MEACKVIEKHGCYWCPFRVGRICTKYGCDDNSKHGMDLIDVTKTRSIADLKKPFFRGMFIGYSCFENLLKSGEIKEIDISEMVIFT